MDQITHEMRLADWQTIVTNCLSRPVGQSKKQWLAEHDVPEKTYYYWQRRVRQKAYGERQPDSPAVASSPYEFAEIPFIPGRDISGAAAPATAVVRRGGIIVEFNNSVSDHLLNRILEVLAHA